MDARHLASYEILKTLIGFPTVSRDSNLALIDWVEDYLTGHGAVCRRTYDDGGSKANLFATIGPVDVQGIVLSGHTDVVPIDGQEWDTDPFELVTRENRLYGRGTTDMKSFLAAALAAVPRFAASRLRKPLHLAFSYDEEVGCIGVRRMIEDVARTLPRPELCIVGEPTRMKPMVAHKGKLNVRVHVRGLECHSSLAPKGVNAVEYAAELISFLRRTAQGRRTAGPFDRKFDIAHTTVHVGLIQGGTALNIVPQDCWFDFEVRAIPLDDRYALLDEVKAFAHGRLEPEMKAVDPRCGFRWEILSSVPGLDMPEDDPATQLVSHLSGANDVGKVAFGTEAGLFQQEGGIPTVICGPGDIDQAHKPNEFIEIEQIAACEAFVERLRERLAA